MILVEYAYSFLRLILTLPNFDFITAQSSLITAQMGSVTPPILGPAHIHKHCGCVDHVLSFLPPASSDYTTVSMDLTFNAGSTNQTVMISITGDTVVESTESFTVSLTTGDSAVNLNPSITTVTIQDDDSKFWYIHEIGIGGHLSDLGSGLVGI